MRNDDHVKNYYVSFTAISNWIFKVNKGFKSQHKEMTMIFMGGCAELAEGSGL